MKRLRFVSSLWVPLVFAAFPAAAQTPPGSRAVPAPAANHREESRFQMNVMEDAFQRAIEATHGRALDALQVNAGMPPMFTLDGNTRARAFRIDGYGVVFDVDLPPIPKSVEWSFRVLDSSAALLPDIQQLQQQLARLNDPRLSRALDIIRRMEGKVSNAGATVAGASGQTDAGGVKSTLIDTRASAPDPFAAYLDDLKKTLVQVMLEYGPTIRLGADEWLHVTAREMSPKLLPGNPTDATITLRIKASDLNALKAGRLTADEAARRIEYREVY